MTRQRTAFDVMPSQLMHSALCAGHSQRRATATDAPTDRSVINAALRSQLAAARDASRLERRERQRTSNARRARLSRRVAAGSWYDLSRLSQQWKLLCHATFNAMLMCCLCGAVHLGHTREWVTSMAVSSNLASPAAVSNIFFRQFTQHLGCKVMCPPCQEHARRSNHLVYMEPAYLLDLLTAPPLSMQLLSLVDTSMAISRHWSGYHHSYSSVTSLLDQPLIRWRRHNDIH